MARHAYSRCASEPIQSKEFKILQDNKDDLLSVLPSIKLLKFADQLLQSVIITGEVNGVFRSLDHSKLDSKLRYRYLLQRVCEGVLYDQTAFYRFLLVMGRYGGSAEQLSKRLKRELHRPESKEIWKFPETVVEVVSKVVSDDIYLSQGDVPILMESLVEISNKWEEIGIALSLPRLSVRECRGSNDPVISLTNILCRWISCNQKETTLNKLKLALGSQLVGRGSFVPFMEEKFREGKSAKVLMAKKEGSGSEDQFCDEAGISEMVVCTKQPEALGEIYLLAKHVSILAELLVVCAHKWSLIGTSLCLPVSVMRELEGKCLTSEANILCLRDVLFVWITAEYELDERPTLKILKLALESQLVGSCTAANRLEERFIKKVRGQDVLSVSVLPAPKKAHLGSTLVIIHQPREVEVTDGKSTLLAVQVNVSELVSFKWMKDGRSLSNGPAYLGTCSDILVVRLASQGSEGKFTCHIHSSSEEVISKVITLTVIFTPEKKHLINFYSKRREIPKGLWPIVDTSTFVDLSLFTKNRPGFDNSDYSVEGDVIDILENSDKVDYEEVFGKFGRSILMSVEGRTGSGKTTLMNKITRDWAVRGDALKNARMVFHISLRDFPNSRDKSLCSLLEIFYPSKEECQNVVDDIKLCGGEDVCFILDGLDSYHTEHEKDSVVYHLCRKVFLPASMVIVTSCPLSPISLTRETAHVQVVEVLGFTKPQVFKYIDVFPFSSNVSNDTATNLKAYLDSHPNVLNMCYMPIHVAMICFLYEHQKADVPCSETEIYKHLTRFFVLRKLRQSDKKVLLHSVEDLSGKDHQVHLKKVCHIAFDMCIQSKQVILRGSTQVRLSSTCSSIAPPTFDLITTDSTATLYGHDNRYSFLHLTFQKYLAAFYIAKLEEDKQMEMIKLYAREQYMQMVWKFYCGIVNFEAKEAQVQEIMISADNLHKVQCAFESKQRVVCDSVLEFGRTSVLDLHVGNLTTSDLTAVAYVVSTTSHVVTKLAMIGCGLRDDHVKAFMTEVSKDKLICMQTLDLSSNNIGDDGAATLADGLKFCNSRLSLYLSNNNIGAAGAEALANLKCRIHYE